MATYPIKRLGELGVISDLAPTDLPPNAFTNAINARFIESRVFKTGGCAPLSYVEEDKNLVPLAFTSIPFDYFSGGESFMVVGDASKLYKLNDNALEDISRKVVSRFYTSRVRITIHPKVSRIVLDKGNFQLLQGDSSVIVARTLPDGSDNKPAARPVDLVWESSNPSILSVTPDPSSTLTATVSAADGAEGPVAITVYTKDRTISTTIVVTVLNKVQGVVVSETSKIMRRGTSGSIFATIIPDSAVDKDVIWISSNTGIVTITPSTGDSRNATITAVLEGSAVITARSVANPSQEASCLVTVLPLVDSISLNYTSLDLGLGAYANLLVTFSPTNDIPNKNITWSTDRTSVVQLLGVGTSCQVKGLAFGTAIVTARSEEGDRVATCSIRVTSNGGTGNRVAAVAVESFEEPLSRESLEPMLMSMKSVNQSNLMSLGDEFSFNDVSLQDIEVVDSEDGEYIPARTGASLSATSLIPLTGLSLTASDLNIDVGDTFTISAIVVPEDANNLIYNWQVSSKGFVSLGSMKDKDITFKAESSGEVIIGCIVSQMVQKDYIATPDHPWYDTIIANCCVMTTYEEVPQVKIFDENYFKDLPGWGEQTFVGDDGDVKVNKYDWKCERVRAFNNRLFALNMRESNASGVTTHFPLRLRWSNFANENDAPTLWDDLAYNRNVDSSNLAAGVAVAGGIIGQVEALENGYAGYIDLADSNGNLMDILPLKDYLFIYTEFETYVGSPTMNSYQPLMFKKLFNDSGILAPDCVVEVEGGHFVVTQNDIILHNGASKKSLASNRVKDKIINEVSQVTPLATKVHLHQDKKEVWILYVGDDQERGSYSCTRAAVWNYEYDTWSFRTIPCAYDIALVDPPTLQRGPTWDDFVTITWDEISPDVDDNPLIWRRDVSNFHKRITLVASSMTGFYEMDVGPWDYRWDLNTQAVIKEPLVMRLERSGIDFDNETNEWNQKHVNNFRPQVNGTGTYTFEVGGTQYSNEYGHKHSTKTFTVGKDRHVSVRLNHPYLYYNVIDNDIESNASMNAITIEYVVGGRR